MKRLLQFIWLFIISLGATAQTEVVLNINHLFGENPYMYDTPVTVEAGYEMKVLRLEYYLGDFVITHDGGQTLDLSETHLLVNANDSQPLSLGMHDVNTIEAVSFSVGVIEALNHLDPAEYEMGEPLAPQLPSMHWGWASGYRFLAFEGKSGANLTTTFEIHSLGDENLMNQSHSLTVEATDGIANIYLDADYLELVNNLDVSQGLIMHGSSDEAVDALLNMRSLVFSVGAPLNVQNSEATGFEMYPNPTTNQCLIAMDQTLVGAELNVYNMSGQLVKNDSNLQSTYILDVTDLPTGMYYVKIRSANTVQGKLLSVK